MIQTPVPALLIYPGLVGLLILPIPMPQLITESDPVLPVLFSLCLCEPELLTTFLPGLPVLRATLGLDVGLPAAVLALLGLRLL